MTLEEFAELVDCHDLTYEYSDDHRYWSNGDAQYRRIVQAAKEFPRKEVVRIWNAAVDRKIREGFREPFYWKE